MNRMKYWLYLIAKLAIAAGLVYGLQFELLYYYCDPPPPVAQLAPGLPIIRGGEFVVPTGKIVAGSPFPLLLHDMLFTFLILGVWLIGAGLFSLSFWDQRRRCRNCLRRLIMPVASGSWGNMVTFGRPRTELICPYGHGTLSIEELQITGRHLPDWQPHDDDIWKELESFDQTPK